MVSELKRKLVCAHMWACDESVVNVCPLDLVIGCYSCIGGVDRLLLSNLTLKLGI